MRRTNIAATKSTLLQLKQHFTFVQSAHELLDEKREVLLEELIDTYRDAGQLRRDLEARLTALYAAVRAALLGGGRPLVEQEALAFAGDQRLRLRERSIMGVIVPLLDSDVDELTSPATAPGWTHPAATQARRAVRELLPALVRLAEIEVSCRRLAAELQKTKRKVNALENIFIPEYRDTIHFIEGALEEKEREALFQLKRLKARQQADEDEGR